MAKDENIVSTLGKWVALASAFVGLVGAFKRVSCPCGCGFLPFFGDTELFGERYCRNCGHYH